jgi:glycerophosphoryl diester phosphodiesterase
MKSGSGIKSKLKIICICVIVLLVFQISAVSVVFQTNAEHVALFAFDPSKSEFTEIGIEIVPAESGQAVIAMAPFRQVFESLGAYVLWDERLETAYAIGENLFIAARIGDQTAFVNGKHIIMPRAPETINGRTYVALDFITDLVTEAKAPGAVISKRTRGGTEIIKLWRGDNFIKRHGWTQLSDGLIAHAGGGLFEYDENGKRFDVIYTNSLEALLFAYGNGHRVFEIDFLLTSDGYLAATHDWHRHGDGGIKSSEEWRGHKIYGKYTSMFICGVYEFMLEHPDSFLVTDTKSFFYSPENARRQFEIIVDTAKAMDESLLKRIVPQVYDQDIYKILMQVYPFESVIYTLYESPDSDAEVVDFVAANSNIGAVTMGGYRYSEKFFSDLKELGVYIYFYTINVHREIEMFRQWGVHGFYTDFINPR